MLYLKDEEKMMILIFLLASREEKEKSRHDLYYQFNLTFVFINIVSPLFVFNWIIFCSSKQRRIDLKFHYLIFWEKINV